MGRVAKELGALAVSRLSEPGLHFVGGVSGLALQVLPTGGRSWLLRVSVGGKRQEIGLGGFPSVSLAAAREAARTTRQKIKDGINPVQERAEVAAKLKAERVGALTFQHCAERFIESHAPTWKNAKHLAQWSSTLEAYAYPHFGSLSVREVELSHVLAALEPIWQTKTETATRLRGRIEQVLDWATARGQRDTLNPARWRGHLDKLLPAPAKLKGETHQPALPAQLMGSFMTRLRAVEGMSARALEFAILTGARSGEAMGATWGEIDVDGATWTIPAARMKANREHRVPLSGAALTLLATLPRMASTDAVFPSPRGKFLSDMALTVLLRRLNEADGGRWVDPKAGRPVVTHGFRSTFRDWAAERTAYPRELAEVALAHSVAGKTEAAYWRGDLLAKRMQMMEDWAAFIARAEPAGANVVAIRAA